MRRILVAALAIMLAACAAPGGGGGGSGGVPLSPASPQPDAGALAPGLAVAYAYPSDIRMLAQTRKYRDNAHPGPPLRGLDYPDTERGDVALTSRGSERVIAFIDGYLRIDEPGTYQFQFWSNDGLEMKIGGVNVYTDDLRHVCRNLGWRSFTAPKPGWYKVEATFFQRLNTSCLMMDWRTPEGREGRVPAELFAHRKG